MRAVREPLPGRRLSNIIHFEYEGRGYDADIGFYPDGRPGEVFIDGAKIGSREAAELHDAAIMISLLLQFGVPAELLARTIGARIRADRRTASVFGTVANVVAEAKPIGTEKENGA